MRKILPFTLLLFLFTFSQAQILEPVKWSFKTEPISEDEFYLVFEAKIDKGWYIYSQTIEGDGPIATSFSFDKNAQVSFSGKTSETGDVVKEGMDEVFGIEIKKFGKRAVFKQKVKSSDIAAKVTGTLEFMTCDDEKCLPPDEVEFTFTFPKPTKEVKTGSAEQKTESIEEPKISISGSFNPQNISESASDKGLIKPVKWKYRQQHIDKDTFLLVFEAHIDEGWYIYSQNIEGDGPIPTAITIDSHDKMKLLGSISESATKMIEGLDSVFGIPVTKLGGIAAFMQKAILKDTSMVVTGQVEFMACDAEKCIPPQIEEFPFREFVAPAIDTQKKAAFRPAVNTATRSLLGIFIAGFIGGLLALLTPCVFPIIPMTVSFFTKTSKTRQKAISNAFLYSVSIIVIYVLLGFIVTKSLGADALNAMASNAFFNLAFFFIFVIFAISFFGYFEITLPASFVNKMDSMSDRGGLIGIFFMAFTLSLVSFSCTGPIIGTLLVEAAVGGNNTGPLMGMFGFSLALALPFGLFAAFPGWLNTLPKSGGWLNSVKVVLGFLELGLALKFLSNVDLAYHWGFLKREIFLGIWLVIAVLTGLYILGKIRFPHDSRLEIISPARWVFASIFFAFALYLIPGLKGANLKLLSGFPPPAFYSIFETKSKCPHDILCFKDLEQGLAYAKQVNKPVLLDFTGWSCVNCRKMEENVWIEPEILSMLNDKYVLVSLYVDDKTTLPEKEQRVSECTGKKIRNIGNKWSEYQTCAFSINTQPYYVLMRSNGELLNEPVGYTPNASEYKAFLEEGIERF